ASSAAGYADDGVAVALESRPRPPFGRATAQRGVAHGSTPRRVRARVRKTLARIRVAKVREHAIAAALGTSVLAMRHDALGEIAVRAARVGEALQLDAAFAELRRAAFDIGDDAA